MGNSHTSSRVYQDRFVLIVGREGVTVAEVSYQERNRYSYTRTDGTFYPSFPTVVEALEWVAEQGDLYAEILTALPSRYRKADDGPNRGQWFGYEYAPTGAA